jgi:3-oxoacyl-[acyl-carrier protein] reductase
VSESGPVALVTGGNRGIGAAIVRELATAGFQAVAASRAGAPVGDIPGVTLDVTSTTSVDDAFAEVEERFGVPEVVVANAGITRDTLLVRMTDEDIDDVLQTNLVGAIRCARRAARGMIRARGGRIILISSVVWALGSAGQVNYAAAKAGMVGAARSLARELGGRGVTVNVIAPGFIDTDMTAALEDSQREAILANIPAGRYGLAEEIAHAAVFLAGDRAAYINGAVIPVDGGLGMGH